MDEKLALTNEENNEGALTSSMNTTGEVKIIIDNLVNENTNINALSNFGHQITLNTLNALTFSYSIALIGILGSGTDKFLPVGDFYSLRYELTMDAYANCTAGVTANKVTGCTISEVEFCGQVIELDSTP
jgi:hypothetical protein